MSDTKYAPPLDKLLTLGEVDWIDPDKWEDYLALGIGREHIPDLLRMVNDKELNGPEADEPESWAPVHALHALGQLRDESLIQPLLQILTDHESDEAIEEDMPGVFGLIGPAAIPALSDYLADNSHPVYPRSFAADALQVIAERYPEYRTGSIEGITRTLERFEDNDIELNAFLITNLAHLQAVETLPLIEKAFEDEAVEEFIIDLDYVLVQMGLKEPESANETVSAVEELDRNLFKTPTYKLRPSDIEVVTPDFSGAENAPVVDSPPVQTSKPARNFEPIKFSRNKPKKKEKKRRR